MGESSSLSVVPSGPSSGHAPVGFQPHNPVLALALTVRIFLVLAHLSSLYLDVNYSKGEDMTLILLHM